MEEYFTKFFFGGPFEPFGLSHLSALFIILTGNILLFRYGVKRQDQQHKSLRWFLALTLLILQAVWIVWMFWVGEARLQTILPLHLCSLFSLISACALLINYRTLYVFTFYLGGGGAIFALVSPDIGMYDFPHFFFFQTMLSHGFQMVAQTYAVAVDRFRPSLKDIPLVFAGLNVYVGLLILFNHLTGSNYMFLSRKPESPNLLDHLGPYPWYILSIELIGLLTFLLMTIPFIVHNNRKLASFPSRKMG